jgi:DNA-binding MarR family transcriptional regulator
VITRRRWDPWSRAARRLLAAYSSSWHHQQQFHAGGAALPIANDQDLSMPRLTKQQRIDELVAAFTELGPSWRRWIDANLPRDLSYPRLRLLHALDCDPDRAMTMTQLANTLDVTQRRVTALVDALEADQLVERRPHPTDRRSTVVAITKKGVAEQQQLWRSQQAEIGLAFGDLSAEHQKQLLEITPLLTDALRRRAAAGREHAEV